MAISEVKVEPAVLPGERLRVRHTPLTWLRGGGLTTLLFCLPMLIVFGLFSWYPIVRTVVMSLQHTNLVQAPTWVGLDNFRAVLQDPLLPTAVKNTLYFAFLALIFGYPIPLAAAVLMSEVRKRRGLYSVLAYLPVVIPPVVAVLLWKVFYDARSERSTRSSAGSGWARGRGSSPRSGRCPRSCSRRRGRTPAGR